MRIHALLVWYDEHPRWLAATTTSLTRLADHIIAVDGAYLRYPQGRPSSGGEQAETIHATATAHGAACTIHTPATVWMGDEIEKRNATLNLAKALGTPHEDWLLVIDSDETITNASGLTRHDLDQTHMHVAEIAYHTTASNTLDWSGRSRRLYRLLPDLAYTTTHFTMTATDPDTNCRIYVNGRGVAYNEPAVDALDLTAQVQVQHKHSLRPHHRLAGADAFAAQRHITEPWPEVPA